MAEVLENGEENGESRTIENGHNGDFVPLPVTSTDPADVHVEVTNLTEFCDSVIQTIGELARLRIHECLEECRLTAATCESCIRGLIESELNVIGSTIQECDERIIRNMVSHMAELASLGDSVGVPLPPPATLPDPEPITDPVDGPANGNHPPNGDIPNGNPPPPNGNPVPPPPPPIDDPIPPPPPPATCPIPPVCPPEVTCPEPPSVTCPPCDPVVMPPPPPPPTQSPNDTCPPPEIKVQCPSPTIIVQPPPQPPPPQPPPPSCDEIPLYNQWIGASQAIRWRQGITPLQIDEEISRILGAGRGQLWTIESYPDVGRQGRIKIEGCYAAIPALISDSPVTTPPPVDPGSIPPLPPAATPSLPGSFFCFISTAGPGNSPADLYLRAAGSSGIDPGLVSPFSLLTDANPAVNTSLGFLPNTAIFPIRTIIQGSLRVFFSILQGIVSPVIAGAGCVGSAAIANANSLAIARLFGNWFGAIPENVTEPTQQLLNYQCQYKLPSTPQLNDLLSRGWINGTQWNQLVRANGDCVQPQEVIVAALQTVPNINDTIIARRRGIIDNAKYTEYLARNAISSQEIADTFFRITEYVPGPSDLIRFMQRDTADQNVVNKYQYDTDFANKYAGKVKEWADWQGVPEDVFRQFWRAHWQLPSPTQLYEMLHRLRPNDRDPNDPFINLTVTYPDVIEALKINDLAPTWVDKLAAISYRPLTRVDVRRAYEIGVLKEEDVFRSYLDLGYNDANARFLTEFARIDSLAKRAKRAGIPTQIEVTTWYRDLAISKQQAENMLSELGLRDEVIATTLAAADAKRDAAAKKQVLTALRSRYMKGEFSNDQLIAALGNAGIDVQRAGVLIATWGQIRDARYRAPTVTMLCKWWTQGLITTNEVIRRAGNLGFTVEDATRIMLACQNTDAARRQKEALAAQEKAQREAKARAKELAAARKEAMPCKPPPKPTCPPGTVIPNGQVIQA